MNNELWKIDPQGKVTVLVKDYKGKLLNGPNDLWIAPNGGIYFTDPLYKRDYWTRDPAMQQDGQHVYYLAAGPQGADPRDHRPDAAQRHHRHARRQAPLRRRHRRPARPTATRSTRTGRSPTRRSSARWAPTA